MGLRITNTLSGKKEDFVPRDLDRVSMYVCGPTVYFYAHIGNARPVVVFDVLYRYLKSHYKQVLYARNITDVDDKINKAAREANVDISVITQKYTDIYRQDMQALNVLAPYFEPKVTDHIPAIIAEIEALLASGHAYEAEGHVLFDVPSFPQYGALSGRNRDEMIAGARVDVAPYKKDPADFVLWKPSDAQTPGWESPWGRGRPGWHIECTAMIRAVLGTPIDIHGGGQDLIFPHHENEIAQGLCACDDGFARYWMHNGFVNIEGEKMAKSEGNILLVHELLKSWPGEVLRLTLLSSHYRQPLDWSQDRLHAARRTLDGLYRVLGTLDLSTVQPSSTLAPAIQKALDDDLNTPLALSHLHAMGRSLYVATDETARSKIAADMLGAAQILGLLQTDPAVWFQGSADSIEIGDIEALLKKRDAARAEKDFAAADVMRDELLAKGIVVEDSKDGSTWRRL